MSTMSEVQMRADMEALMKRLVQTERALLDTRKQIAAVPKSAPLVVTRTIGKAPMFTREHKNWPEWSFQLIAYMGSSNPKSIEAMRWAAMEDDKITAASFNEHNAQLYLALALLCKGNASVTKKNTEVNNGEAWRGLNAMYDNNNKSRQRVRMQYLYSRNVLSRFCRRPK